MVNAALIEPCVRLARHAAFNERQSLVNSLADLGAALSSTTSTQVAELTATLRYHHIAPLIAASIKYVDAGSELDPNVRESIERACVRQPSEATLLRAFDEMQRALGAAAVEAVLLKGIHFARRLYGGYDRRPQYDLDVLVRAGDRARARRELARIGYTRSTYDLHSETFVRSPDAANAEAASKVDVHGWLRRAPAYRIDEQALWRGVRGVPLGSVNVLTLSDEYNLLLLGLSCFEDLGQGMAKIKQLLDTLLFLRDVDRAIDWDGFFERRATEGVASILAHVFALVVLLFDALEEVPCLRAALVARGSRAAVPTRALATALTSAPRKDPANFAWFARVYPGNVWVYLAWFWMAGFPENAKGLQPARLWGTVAAARRH